MKTYWHIPGCQDGRHGDHCIVFDKLDGNQIRAEWNRKRKWYKFGTRTRLLDESDAEYGCAIGLFMEKYADDLTRAIFDQKVQHAISFLELHGPNSFCGIHVPGETLTVTLFDVDLNKRGIMPPYDFLRMFGHLDVPRVLYEGEYNQKLIDKVRAEIYPVTFEGVVCKGVYPGSKSANHRLWMSKIKTIRWLNALRQRAAEEPDNKILQLALRENNDEQLFS